MKKKHLCDNCKFEVPTCSAKIILFGCDVPKSAKNDDNILECDCYIKEVD